MSHPSSSNQPGIEASQDPEVRLKRLVEQSNNILIKKSISINMYAKSAREMYRSAKSYLDDGSLECAYILCMRFLTLVLERLRDHPNYKEIAPEDKVMLTKNCKELFPLAEEIKKKLLEVFKKEHVLYLEEQRRLEEQEEQERIRREAERLKREALSKDVDRNFSVAPVPDNYGYNFLPTAPSYTPPTPPAPPVNAFNSISEYSDLPRSDYYTGSGGNTPHFDRSSKPARILSPVHSGLRQLRVPADLPVKFLELAKTNTSKNCETCGILGGKIVREKLVLTHMIIPKQTGSSDSCTMQKEEEILFFQDAFNLITLGWIHTHPSQTAFLSSVDLHTQYSYQLMMPEAIAIVCAPTHNQTGIFQINPTVGMETISKCCNSTLFHPHPESSTPLFYEPSHVIMDNSLTVSVEDLRLTP